MQGLAHQRADIPGLFSFSLAHSSCQVLCIAWVCSLFDLRRRPLKAVILKIKVIITVINEIAISLGTFPVIAEASVMDAYEQGEVKCYFYRGKLCVSGNVETIDLNNEQQKNNEKDIMYQ